MTVYSSGSCCVTHAVPSAISAALALAPSLLRRDIANRRGLLKSLSRTLTVGVMSLTSPTARWMSLCVLAVIAMMMVCDVEVSSRLIKCY